MTIGNNDRWRRTIHGLSIFLLTAFLFSCAHTVYVEGTIPIADYIDEEDRGFSYESESVGSGQELPWEQSPIISLYLGGELHEIVITDEMTLEVGIKVEVTDFSGDIDLDLHLKAYISELGDPDIWDAGSAFEFTLENIQASGTHSESQVFDLTDRLQDVLHSMEPVYFALEATLENQGGAGIYTGQLIVEEINLHYKGHKTL